MFFKFDRVNQLIEQLPAISQVTQLWASLQQWVSVVSNQLNGVARSYAQQYALVQQSQYDSNGNVTDVTSAERVTVPESVLSQAKAALTSLQLSVDNAPTPAPITVQGEVAATQVEDPIVQEVDVLVNNSVIRVNFDTMMATSPTSVKLSDLVPQAGASANYAKVPRIGFPLVVNNDIAIVAQFKPESDAYDEDTITTVTDTYRPVNNAPVRLQEAVSASQVGSKLMVTYVISVSNGTKTIRKQLSLPTDEIASPNGVKWASASNQQMNNVMNAYTTIDFSGQALTKAPTISVFGTVSGVVDFSDAFKSVVTAIPIQQAIDALSAEE